MNPQDLNKCDWNTNELLTSIFVFKRLDEVINSLINGSQYSFHVIEERERKKHFITTFYLINSARERLDLLVLLLLLQRYNLIVNDVYEATPLFF